jgi:hypothetical protein
MGLDAFRATSLSRANSDASAAPLAAGISHLVATPSGSRACAGPGRAYDDLRDE